MAAATGLSAFAEYMRCPEPLLTAPAVDGNRFPDDTTATVDRLRYERYLDNRLPGEADAGVKALTRKAYYALRPLLPVAVRKHAQRWALRDWRTLAFPRWPVDVTVEELMAATFSDLLDAHACSELPFIWFWPDGHNAAAIMTHDVETTVGRDFSGALMKMEDAHDVRSAFEIVPEERYEVPGSYLDDIRSAGCEVCVHGLNHDGRLFLTEAIFRERVKKINAYGHQFGATGFRSPVMYRRLDWYDGFDFRYDMSVPNVAHLDPQRGGCCTVMPYFVAGLVELPLTTTQDYQLYHILKRCDLALWKEQCEIIQRHHGLMSFIIHPDYTTESQARSLYAQLLDYLAQLRENRGVWVALPGQVERWWRQRRELRLEQGQTEQWRVVGNGAERARVAFAFRDGDRVRYRLDAAPCARTQVFPSANPEHTLMRHS